MADGEEYDPDANVPLWVNIVIPIISVVIFVGALVFVYFLPYEIDVERLELWAEKLHLKKKEPTSYRNKNPAGNIYSIERKSHINKTYVNDTGSEITSENRSMRSSQQSYYGSTGTMTTGISFESSV